MQDVSKPSKKSFLIRHSFWLSLLLHSLFLLSFAVVMVGQSQKEEDLLPSYLPAYAVNQMPVPETKEKAIDAPKPMPPLPQDKIGLKRIAQTKPSQAETENKPKPVPKQKAAQAMRGKPEPISDPNSKEAMHLIGETKIMKPLIKILAASLSKHLFYPRSAAEFGLTGRVLVGFTLYPEGTVMNASVVKSSGAGVLDDAARRAVSEMSPVPGVGEFVSKPEYLVVGIIFS